MTIHSTTITAIFMFLMAGCAAEQAKTNSVLSEATEESRILRQSVSVSDENTQREGTCLEQCGQEARGTIYADCLAEGGERKDCGTTGREWYRNCLETRCDESAILQDDCRTECRMDSKKDYHQCVEETDAVQDCRMRIKTNTQECIAECG